MIQQLRWAGAALSVLPLIVGCRVSNPLEQPRIDIRGNITTIQQVAAPDSLAIVLIEGVIEPDTQFDRAAVRITDQTRIVEQVGTEWRTTTAAALNAGQRVQARFTGPVAESYPVQAMAAEIMILTQ